MVNFLTILLRVYRKKGEGFSFFNASHTTAIDISTKICKTNFGARLSQQLFRWKALSNQRMGMSHARGCCRRLGVILTPTSSFPIRDLGMVNFLTILLRVYRKKGEGFSFFNASHNDCNRHIDQNL